MSQIARMSACNGLSSKDAIRALSCKRWQALRHREGERERAVDIQECCTPWKNGAPKMTDPGNCTPSHLSGTGDSQRDSRESIESFAIENPYFYSASGRTWICDSCESPDSRESRHCTSSHPCARHAPLLRAPQSTKPPKFAPPPTRHTNRRSPCARRGGDFVWLFDNGAGLLPDLRAYQGWPQVFSALFSPKHRKMSTFMARNATFFLRERQVARNSGDTPVTDRARKTHKFQNESFGAKIGPLEDPCCAIPYRI